MKLRILSPILFCGALAAQQIPAVSPFKDDTLIATVDGRKITYGEINGYLNVLGPEKRAVALSDPENLIKQYATQLKMVEQAEKDKLDQISPYKEAIEVNRRLLLTNAELNYRSLNLPVSAEEQQKYYDAHKDRYTQVNLQEIYLAFTSDEVAKENPKKYRNEAQTKALATRLRAEAKTSADFVRLAKQYSEDEASKAKNGEFGVMKMSDTNVPPEIKSAVFALKEGQVSQPLQQQNGYYLFRAQSVGLRPYADVKDEIYSALKDEGMKAWIDNLQKNITIKLDNALFFAPPAGANAPAKP